MKITSFIQYLESERNSCLAQANALVNDERRDEANMLKTRANIFDIFAVISRTAEKNFPQNPADFIGSKIETIPQSWKVSLALAEEQNANNKIMAERVKLQAVLEISRQFNDVLGGGKS